MGFFSSILGGITGGSKSSSSSGGFNQLPASIQDAYKGFGDQINSVLSSGTIPTAFKPLPLAAGEQSAIDKLFAGFAPTEQSIQSDIAMQSNPYDKYVIDEINRQAQGDFSIFKQYMDSAGQMGSNRGALGANDIDLSRLNQIGKFKQENYNTALNNALTTLPGMRQEDAAGALAGGTFARDIDMASNASTITALQELAKALGILPTVEGSSSSTSKSSNGIGVKGAGLLLSGLGGLFG